jgi:hypothetical protein
MHCKERQGWARVSKAMEGYATPGNARLVQASIGKDMYE